MTEPAKKQRNTNGPLPPATCADRIAKILEEAPRRILKKEAEVTALKLAIACDLRDLYERCTDESKIGNVLHALGVDIQSAIDRGYWRTAAPVVSRSADVQSDVNEGIAADPEDIPNGAVGNGGIPAALLADAPALRPGERIVPKGGKTGAVSQ